MRLDFEKGDVSKSLYPRKVAFQKMFFSPVKLKEHLKLYEVTKHVFKDWFTYFLLFIFLKSI